LLRALELPVWASEHRFDPDVPMAGYRGDIVGQQGMGDYCCFWPCCRVSAHPFPKVWKVLTGVDVANYVVFRGFLLTGRVK